MNAVRPTVLVTGVSGNLGTRLLPLLTTDFDVVGVDLCPPRDCKLARFEKMDLGKEASCEQLVRLLKETKAFAVVHLAFVIDPHRTGVLDEDRMWRINVPGTARVMEAIAEVNRLYGGVSKFIFPSSVSAYGPETPEFVNEGFPLGAHTLPYAIHKQECDEVVRQRADGMGACSSYILRPHIFAGASVQNYLIGVLRGTPLGTGKWAERLRSRGARLPLMIPFGRHSVEKLFQFVHIDDMARLLAHLVRRETAPGSITVLNVAGRGSALTLAQVAEIANAKLWRSPRWFTRMMLKFLWKMEVSTVPPDALPYMIGSYTMDTARLKKFLGADYERVIRYTIQDALADSFREVETADQAVSVTP
jgi:nucleoside-diphosphate-sugar epimerase